MDETHLAPLPTAAYGAIVAMSSIAYLLLERTLIAASGKASPLAKAVGRDRKALLSLSVYIAAMALAFVEPWIAIALYVLVALMWFIPDRRIESQATPDS